MGRALGLIGACSVAIFLAPGLALAASMAVSAAPGQVLVCRLSEPPAEDAGLAGFGQRAGFYHSRVDQSWVALLAVPLEEGPGPRALALEGAGPEQSLPVRVVEDPYPFRRLRVPGLKGRLKRAGAKDEQEALAQVRIDAPAGLPQWKGPFRWPLDGEIHVTSAFGTRRSYNKGQAAWRHRGLDLRAPVGTPVLAANEGEVLWAQPDMAVSGGTVVLGHGYGLSSAYYHLSAILVKPGQRVAKGQRLGLSGESGLAAGPHLHWQMELRGHAVDPGQWLPKAPLTTQGGRTPDHG